MLPFYSCFMVQRYFILWLLPNEYKKKKRIPYHYEIPCGFRLPIAFCWHIAVCTQVRCGYMSRHPVALTSATYLQ